MLEIAYTQHCGKVYRTQQDALWNGEVCIQAVNAAPASHVSSLPCLLAIADGVAISPSPQLASRFVIGQLAVRPDLEDLSSKTIRSLHGDLCDNYAHGKTFGTSTTLVAAYLDSDRTTIVNVGDSRAYLISSQSSWAVLTRDHTVLNELIDADLADPSTEYASLYNALSDCLIADYEEYQFAIHQGHVQMRKGDSLLLCSDGVHDVLGKNRLEALFDQGLSTQQQVETWRKAILRAGAPDNFSIILARSLHDCAA